MDRPSLVAAATAVLVVDLVSCAIKSGGGNSFGGHVVWSRDFGGWCNRGSNVLASAAAALPVPWKHAISSVATAVVTVVA